MIAMRKEGAGKGDLPREAPLPRPTRLTGRVARTRLEKSRRKILVQVAPGRWIKTAQEDPPEHCVAKWIRQADGAYQLMPEEMRLARLDSRLAKLLGFDGQYDTLFRLGRMGCVEIIRIAPRVHFLNLDSWMNHLARCAENPELWDEGGEFLEEYRKAL